MCWEEGTQGVIRCSERVLTQIIIKALDMLGFTYSLLVSLNVNSPTILHCAN